jgi:flagellin
MSVINTNVKSLFAQNALTSNNRSLNTAMEQLSTGKRINRAANDAAGLAIAEKMTSQIRGLNMAIRNINDGISLAQTAEGALNEVSGLMQRMRELKVQEQNGTYDAAQKLYITNEMKDLGKQIDNIVNNTKWNTLEIKATAGFKITDTEDGGTAEGGLLVKFVSTGITGLKDDSTVAGIDTAIGKVNEQRSALGAMINRMVFAADNLSNVSMNISASRSQILDTDYASATADLARTQIVQQAATAMLAQANQQPASVLSLLQ